MAINPNGIASLDVVGNANLVDGLNYRIEFSKVLAQNIFVQLRTRVGQAVTGKYVPNGIKAGHVVVNRVKRAGMKPRTLGLTSGNSGLVNQSAKKAIATDQYHVQLMHVYDNVFQIPRIAATLMPVELVNETLFNIAGEVYEFIDSSTIATMLLAANKLESFGAAVTQVTGALVVGDAYEITEAANTAADFTGAGAAANTVGTQFVATTTGTASATPGSYKAINKTFVELASTPDYLASVKSAIKILKKGDISNGIAMFEPTVIIARPDFVLDLLSSAGVVQGGSNFAQLMIAQGTLSPEASYMQYGVGTKGMVLSYPVVEAPDYLFDLAIEWFSASTLDTFAGKVQALVLSDIATVRGIADEYMNVMQSTEVNATNLLPLFQWGVEAMYGTGIVPIVSNGTAQVTPDSVASLKIQGWDTV